MTLHADVLALIQRESLDLVVVPDTSILINNPDLADWDVGRPSLIAISQVVLGELERHKTATRDAEITQAANGVMKTLAQASSAQKADLLRGVRIGPRTWCATVAVDRATLASGLDAKHNDQQIAGAAGVVAEAVHVPTVLLTADINQKVFASSVGIPAHLEPRPFEPGALEGLHDYIAHIETRQRQPLPAEPLDNNLPPREAVVTNFIGRRDHLDELQQWLLNPDARKWALTGDGGKGKTAIAYAFAESVVLAAPTNIVGNVVWMSAKRRRYIEGTIATVSQPDFSSLEQALDFLLRYFNDAAALERSLSVKRERAIEWLTTFPTLIVADDLDSIEAAEEDVTEFFLEDILKTNSRVLLTSRRHYPGMGRRETPVHGLEGEEAANFINTKILEFGLDPQRFVDNLDRLVKVTEGSPLYIEDLLRLCHVSGVSDAIHQWERRRGEEARRYALEREVEELTRSSRVDRDVLIACAVAGGPVTVAQLCLVCNQERDEIEIALEHLRQFYLMPAPSIVEDIVWFDLNGNTRAQILAQFGNSDEARRIRGAFVALGTRSQESKVDESIAAATREARLLMSTERWSDAETLLLDAAKRFGEHHQLLHALGTLYSRWEPSPKATEAREAFERAHQLGSPIEGVYIEWASLEERLGEFRRAYQVAEMGLLRFHQSMSLRLRQIATLNELAEQLDRRLDREGARSARRNVVSIARDVAFLATRNDVQRRQKLQVIELGQRAARALRDDRSQRELGEAFAAASEQEATIPLRAPGGDPRLRDALAGVAPLRIADRDLARAKTIETIQALEGSADFVDQLRLQGLAMATISTALVHAIPGFDPQRLGYTSVVSFLQVTLNGSPYRLARSSLSLTAEARLVIRARPPDGFVMLPDMSDDDLAAETGLAMDEVAGRARRVLSQMRNESAFAIAVTGDGIQLVEVGKALRQQIPTFTPERFGFKTLTNFLQYALAGTELCVAQDPKAIAPARSRVCLRSLVPTEYVVLPDVAGH